MSDKLIQYGDEVAYNEDFNDLQDLATRSSNRVLEGLQYRECENTHSAGSYFIPLRIINGFELTFAADGSLDFSISNGEALVAHNESLELDGNVWSDVTSHYYAQAKRNNVQQARYSSSASGVYPYSVVANAELVKDRIDIVEIKFDRAETSQDRYKLVTIDNRRVAQLVSVEKYVEYVLSDVRIRRGLPVEPPSSPSYTYGPRMPALDPSVSVPAQFEWLPIAAVYIPANTSGFSSQPEIIDLRLFYQPKIANNLLNGPVSSINVTTHGEGAIGGPWDQQISVTKNCIVDDGEFFPISGVSKEYELESPPTGWITLSVAPQYHSYYVEESCWPMAIGLFYFLYSFRASQRIGTTGLCVTATDPTGTYLASYGKAGNPYNSISPPTPWPNRYDYVDPNSPTSGTLGAYIKDHAHYLASFACYTDALSIINPRPFKRYGNYVSLTGQSEDCAGGSAHTGTGTNCIFGGSFIHSTSEYIAVQAYTNPPATTSAPPGPTRVVPMHAAAIKVRIDCHWNTGTGYGSINICSEEGENNPAGAGHIYKLLNISLVDTDAPVQYVLDIPLNPNTDYDTMFWLQSLISTSANIWLDIWILGYYEQF